MAIPVGAPAWVDLAAEQIAEVRDFYTELFGWRWIKRPDYNIALKDSTPVAGVMPPETDAPAAWMLYLECGSARRAVERIRALGGKVLVPPTETPADETFLVAEDPSGAPIGLWESPPNAAFGRDHPGMLCWAELHTRDSSSADPFYAELLGYRQEQIGEPGEGFDYTVWYVDDLPTVGRFETSSALPEDVPAHWQLYFQVDPAVGTDATAAKAAELGGAVLREPSDSPHGRLSLVRDVAGATFFVIDTSQRTGE
ncbi:putative glyoxalase/bleomycin resistance protein [Saccharopolyspora subtropica]|uniref:Glyoxalase/bleomycin resistance protein n=1 Tax=Saccharopolyspora thermophila TaxID=89367 RepID=A0A917N997_9PSEU|nr:VOC family protein [Saccharopolyspora subtropica]GGI74047.1 putative glyoxalase/bleomycin resistance protein [Saccharopolyspora subtropica]